MLLATACRS